MFPRSLSTHLFSMGTNFTSPFPTPVNDQLFQIEHFPTPAAGYLTSIQYFPNTSTLRVFYNDGRVYDFAGVPLNVYQNFTTATFKDLYYEKYILGEFPPATGVPSYPVTRIL